MNIIRVEKLFGSIIKKQGGFVIEGKEGVDLSLRLFDKSLFFC
jgi:hypothetical protein